MRILGLDAPPLSQDVFKLQPAKSDWGAWPLLPQEMLEPRRYYDEQEHRIMKEMSLKELMSYLRIMGKPENEWTRHERQFIEDVLIVTPARVYSISTIDFEKLAHTR